MHLPLTLFSRAFLSSVCWDCFFVCTFFWLLFPEHFLVQFSLLWSSSLFPPCVGFPFQGLFFFSLLWSSFCLHFVFDSLPRASSSLVCCDVVFCLNFVSNSLSLALFWLVCCCLDFCLLYATFSLYVASLVVTFCVFASNVGGLVEAFLGLGQQYLHQKHLAPTTTDVHLKQQHLLLKRFVHCKQFQVCWTRSSVGSTAVCSYAARAKDVNQVKQQKVK